MLQEVGALGGKFVTSFYGYDVSKYVRRKGDLCYARLFRRGDLFLAVSETMRRRLIELGCDDGKTCVHHLGVDLRRFTRASPSP